MKVVTAISSLILLTVSSSAVNVTFDNVYDNARGELSTVACSDGPHGLIIKGYKTFDKLPTFPNIGGAEAVTDRDSDKCGTCWALAYKGKTINVLAIDHATSGFNIAEGAMNALTNDQASVLGRIDATATQVATSVCGL